MSERQDGVDIYRNALIEKLVDSLAGGDTLEQLIEAIEFVLYSLKAHTTMSG